MAQERRPRYSSQISPVTQEGSRLRTMNILLLSGQGLYTTRRLQEAAAHKQLALDVYEMVDIELVAGAGQQGLFHKGDDLLARYDALLVRLFYPFISEVLTVARLFKEAGKVVIDRALTEEGYALSKMYDYLLLAQHGVPIPQSWQLYDSRQIEAIAGQLGYPCILKGVHGAMGSRVYLVHDADALHRTLWKYGAGELVVQEFLPADEDYRVVTVGYQALPFIIKRLPPAGDFRTNAAVGGTFLSLEDPALAAALFPLAEKAASVLGREFAAIDIRMKAGRPLVLEVNRRLDFAAYEEATGFDVASAFLDYVVAQITANSL